MKLAKSTWVIIAAWVVFVGGFAAVSLAMPPGDARKAFGDIVLCIVPPFRQRLPVVERFFTLPAAKQFLDAAGVRLHPVASGPTDRHLSGTGVAHHIADPFSRGHHFFPAHG